MDTNPVLAYTNLAVGAIFVLEFIFSLVIWQSMTFRPRNPEILLAMNDTAWLLFVVITSTLDLAGGRDRDRDPEGPW